VKALCPPVPPIDSELEVIMLWFDRPNQWKYTLLASAVAISCWGMPLSLSSSASDLNRQLAIPLNNGTLHPQRREADRLMQLGGQQRQTGAFTKAIDSWQSALSIYRDLRDVEAQGVVYEYLGGTYVDLGQYVDAEDAMRRRLAIARDLGDYQGQIFGANNLGTVLLQRSQPKEATALFAEALEIAKSVKNGGGIGLSYSNLGLAAYSAGDAAEAVRYYNQATTYRRQANDVLGEANTQNNLGDAYRAMSDYKRAAGAYETARVLSLQSLDRVSEIRSVEGLAFAYEGLGLSTVAVDYLEKRLALARADNNTPEILEALRTLAAYFRRTGDYINTENYYQQAIAVAEAIGDQKTQRLVQRQLEDLRLRQAVKMQPAVRKR
jgi:tetratricopeptide (TPR) repeat protein